MKFIDFFAGIGGFRLGMEIAEMFKWNIETVRRKICAGKIKAVKIGKGYRISEEEVERLKRGE